MTTASDAEFDSAICRPGTIDALPTWPLTSRLISWFGGMFESPGISWCAAYEIHRGRPGSRTALVWI